MKSRRLCREAALQALYQCDTLGDFSLVRFETFLAHFQLQSNLDSEEEGEEESKGIQVDQFCRELVMGVIEHLSFIDEQITLASVHWSLKRMARVDRNILRVATYELAFRQDVPVKVSINEAIEIAKRFSAPEAPTFINGVLDKIAANLPKRSAIPA